MREVVWIRTDVNGHVVEAGRGVNVPTGGVELPDYRGRVAVLLNFRMVNGALVERPLSPAVASAGSQHTIAGLQDGTRIDVIDVTGDERLTSIEVVGSDVTEVIDLPDPGTYDIVVSAPLPARPRTVRVTT